MIDSPTSWHGDGYRPPAELPGGWWEALGPLAAWVQQMLRAAYESGYMAGRLDAARRRLSGPSS